MPGNSFGQLFRITTFGESHGPAIGCVVDGCPSGLAIGPDEINAELARRRPGQSNLTSARSEQDLVEILSGVFEGRATGAPICLVVRNHDQKSADYDHLKDFFRPGHADLTYELKYGRRDYRGGGRASARETAARVAAGAIAQKLLRDLCGTSIVSAVTSVGSLDWELDEQMMTRELVEKSLIRCPDREASSKMETLIANAREEGDSLGGIITTVVRNIPAGLGEPVFDKLSADLAKAMMSINATKGFEIGEGFRAARMAGSQNNDQLEIGNDGQAHALSNHAGGVIGGISTGQPIIFRTAFKPVSTIGKPQQTVTKSGEVKTFEAHGRHDPCVLPRAVPIIDAMTALVLVDHLLRQNATSILSND